MLNCTTAFTEEKIVILDLKYVLKAIFKKLDRALIFLNTNMQPNAIFGIHFY